MGLNEKEISVELGSSESTQGNEGMTKVIDDSALSFNALFQLFDHDLPMNRNPEKDKKMILQAKHWFELLQPEHNYKFIYLEDGLIHRKIANIISNDSSFDITNIRNSLFMSMVNSTPENLIHTLYNYHPDENTVYGENMKYKGYDIKHYLKEVPFNAIPSDLQALLRTTFFYLNHAGYCTDTALKTFIESLYNRAGTFVKIGTDLFYFKTDQRNKTGIHLDSGSFGMLSDYAQNILLKAHHRDRHTESELPHLLEELGNTIEITYQNKIPLITFHDTSIVFAPSTINPRREATENVLVTAPEKLQLLGRQAKQIFEE